MSTVSSWLHRTNARRLTIWKTVDTASDDNGAGSNPLAVDAVGAAGTRNEDVGASNFVGEVLGALVTDDDGGTSRPEKEADQRHPHEAAVTHDDAPGTGQLAARHLQQRQAGRGCTRHVGDRICISYADAGVTRNAVCCSLVIILQVVAVNQLRDLLRRQPSREEKG